MIMKRRRLILERDVYYSCVCMIEREGGGGGECYWRARGSVIGPCLFCIN
jgi:hypothetical protein